MSTDLLAKLDLLPLHSRTPLAWGRSVLADPIALLIDHAFLEKKACNNAMELMTRWPDEWVPGWVETMTSVARDEAAHLAQVTRMLIKRGGKMARTHKSEYANSLRLLGRKGGIQDTIDRLLISAMIEVRSCERFAVLSVSAPDEELALFYRALFSSELGHYKVFLKLSHHLADKPTIALRWQQLLATEARILSEQEPGPRIHSGLACPAS